MTTIETKQVEIKQIEFGTFFGQYKSMAKNAYNGCIQYFGATPEQAHKLGISLMADWGNFLKKAREEAESSGDSTKGKYGSQGKDGEITLKAIQAVEATGKASPAISIGRVIQQLDANRGGLVYDSIKARLVETLHNKLFGEDE